MASCWSLKWQDRPPEEAALLNPAFCGELIARATKDYERLRASPFPLPLAFVVLPLVLHPGTLAALPGRADTIFSSWATDKQAILVEVPERTLRLRPISREALLFLVQHRALTIEPDGLRTGDKPMKLPTKVDESTPAADDIRRAAALLGRWFGSHGAPTQILQTMGVTL